MEADLRREFTWRDGERTIVFGRGALERAARLLGEQGWDRVELLGSKRALATAPSSLLDLAGASAAGGGHCVAADGLRTRPTS